MQENTSELDINISDVAGSLKSMFDNDIAGQKDSSGQNAESAK